MKKSRAILIALLLLSCTGPRPEVVSVRLRPPGQQGDPYWAEVEVLNKGGGSGHADVEVKLIERKSARLLSQRMQLELKPHDRTVLEVPVQAPQGDYEVEAHARFPTP